jgi:hypothetical protein
MARLQLHQIGLRIAQPVRVVDPQPREQAFLQPLQHLAVRGREHLGSLHAQARERVDVEEAAVVDVVAGHAPVGQPIGLRGDQLRQRIEARGIIPAGR